VLCMQQTSSLPTRHRSPLGSPPQGQASPIAGMRTAGCDGAQVENAGNLPSLAVRCDVAARPDPPHAGVWEGIC